MAIGPVGFGVGFLEEVFLFLLLEAEDPLLRLAIVAQQARVDVGCAQRCGTTSWMCCCEGDDSIKCFRCRIVGEEQLFVEFGFFWTQKNEDSTLTGHRRLGQLPYLVLSTVHGTGY